MSDTYKGPFNGDRYNSQPIEKAVRDYAGTLAVHSIFHTIQGEGPFCGVPSVFVRLAGCNLACPICDTEYTSKREMMSPSDILVAITRWQTKGLIVITGGEPFRQPQGVGELTAFLIKCGFFVQIETNGTLPPPKNIAWNINTSERTGAYIVCSPKTGIVNPQIWLHACCAKYVGSSDDINSRDGLPNQALNHPVKDILARPPVEFTQPIFLQPADEQSSSKNSKNLQAVVNSCMTHGHTLQIQFHKLLGVE